MELYRSNTKGFSGYSIVSDRAYTATIGFTIVWGVMLTAIVNRFFGTQLVMSNPLMFLIIYIIAVLAGSFMTRSQSLPICIIGYHLIVIPLGAVVSITLQSYGYDSSIVSKALLMTLAITVLMTGAATLFPRSFLKIGPALGISLIITLIVELIMSFFSSTAYSFMDYVVVLIFSLYIGFDWARAGQMEKTIPNAIYSGTQIFVDLINIFIRLLRIFARSNSNND